MNESTALATGKIHIRSTNMLKREAITAYRTHVAAEAAQTE